MAPVLSHCELSDDSRLRSRRAPTARRDLLGESKAGWRVPGRGYNAVQEVAGNRAARSRGAGTGG